MLTSGSRNLAHFQEERRLLSTTALSHGMNDSGRWNTGRIKDYKPLGAQMKKTGAQVIFPSILSVEGKREARNRKTVHTSIPGSVAGASTRILFFMTVGLSVEIIIC